MLNFKGAFKHFARGGSVTEAREKGFTLIELMVVIAIGGIILAGVVTMFSDAGDQNKSQTAVKNIAQLASAVNSLRDVRQGWAGITETVISRSSSAPSNMMVGAVLTNIFSSPVIVLGALHRYTITYPNVPLKNCIDISAKALTMFNGRTSTGGVFTAGVRVGAAGTTAVSTVAQASASCAATNVLSFTGS